MRGPQMVLGDSGKSTSCWRNSVLSQIYYFSASDPFLNGAYPVSPNRFTAVGRSIARAASDCRSI